MLVLATFALVIEAEEKAQKVILDRAAYISYTVEFWKGKRATIWTLINLVSKVNIMTSAYVKQLGL